MSLRLSDIIKGLLNEGVSDDKVFDAIVNKYYVRIKYDDGIRDNGTNSKGSRVIQPVAIGTTKKGYHVVRAFQPNGNSRRGAPKWKFFRLDRITSWRPMRNMRFNAPPDDSFGEYNRTGDRTMGTFYGNAKFDDLTDPLDRLKADSLNQSSLPKISTKNTQGPIKATQQWKKNVFTSQPNSEKYKKFAQNVANSSNKSQDYWDEYDKALQQANQAPQPPKPNGGPIDNSPNVHDEDSYDVNDADFNENDFIKNTNIRK